MERHVLPLRIDRYDPPLLDALCFTGEVGWARLTTGRSRFSPARTRPRG